MGEEKKKYLKLIEKMEKEQEEIVKEKNKVCIQLSQQLESFKPCKDLDKLIKENTEEKLRLEKMSNDFIRENDKLKKDSTDLNISRMKFRARQQECKKREHYQDVRDTELKELKKKIIL